MDGHLAAARLVQHGHLHTVAEAGGAVAKDDIDVLDEAVVGDIVVGDIVLDVFDAAVVADGDVVQRGVEDARVLVDTAGHIEALRETADADVRIYLRLCSSVICTRDQSSELHAWASKSPISVLVSVRIL